MPSGSCLQNYCSYFVTVVFSSYILERYLLKTQWYLFYLKIGTSHGTKRVPIFPKWYLLHIKMVPFFSKKGTFHSSKWGLLTSKSALWFMSSKLLFLFCYGGLFSLYFRKVPFENTQIPFLSKNRYLPLLKMGSLDFKKWPLVFL